MFKKISFFLSLVLALNVFTVYGDDFTESGTDYGEDVVKKYVKTEEWPYISFFLLNKILPSFANVKNQKILDAGCGTGMWIVPLAARGGRVYGLDLQEKMIEEAAKAVISSKLSECVDLKVGDVAKIHGRVAGR